MLAIVPVLLSAIPQTLDRAALAPIVEPILAEASYGSALALLRGARLGLIVLANKGGDPAERVSQAILGRALPGLMQAAK